LQLGLLDRCGRQVGARLLKCSALLIEASLVILAYLIDARLILLGAGICCRPRLLGTLPSTGQILL
jgi:hypothetical protein